MNIVLTGFMATGKSAVGRVLAKKLGYAFFDTDEMIEKETGLPITQIFSSAGESAFRDMESRIVALVAMLDRVVIATGGGVPLRPDNMNELEKNGKIVFLTARPETVVSRLRAEGVTRPLLAGDDVKVRVSELLEQRKAAYARCHHRVETDGLSPENVADRVREVLGL